MDLTFGRRVVQAAGDSWKLTENNTIWIEINSVHNMENSI